MNQETMYLGRHPILDGKHHISGYEVLPRPLEGPTITETCELNEASIGPILTHLSDLGLERTPGSGHRSFLNLNAEMLSSSLIEGLPKAHVVLSLPGTIEINDDLTRRAEALKALGYSLALNNFTYSASYDPLLKSIDVVTLNPSRMTPEELEEMLDELKRFPLTLLAEDVEDFQQFDRMRELGCSLFRGYYFLRPTVISGKRIDPENITVMKLMNQVLRNADLDIIERTFKESPALSINLLRLLNSASGGLKEKIHSVRHAIVLLGGECLNRWAQILLFIPAETPGDCKPLLEIAVMRARFMELMVLKGALGGEKTMADLAFMTGILSLIEALLKRPMAEILNQLSLVDEVYRALVNHKGLLAELLALSEKMEKSDYMAIDLMSDRCQIEVGLIFEAEWEATVWTQGLLQSL
jgi:c-di-GMP-related signal transduction protein